MEVADQLHAPAVLLPRYPYIHWIRSWVGFKIGLNAVKKRKKNLAPAGNRTPAGQSVARRYID
jgi:hypothetical protein